MDGTNLQSDNRLGPSMGQKNEKRSHLLTSTVDPIQNRILETLINFEENETTEFKVSRISRIVAARILDVVAGDLDNVIQGEFAPYISECAAYLFGEYSQLNRNFMACNEHEALYIGLQLISAVNVLVVREQLQKSTDPAAEQKLRTAPNRPGEIPKKFYTIHGRELFNLAKTNQPLSNNIAILIRNLITHKQNAIAKFAELNGSDNRVAVLNFPQNDGGIDFQTSNADGQVAQIFDITTGQSIDITDILEIPIADSSISDNSVNSLEAEQHLSEVSSDQLVQIKKLFSQEIIETISIEKYEQITKLAENLLQIIIKGNLIEDLSSENVVDILYLLQRDLIQLYVDQNNIDTDQFTLSNTTNFSQFDAIQSVLIDNKLLIQNILSGYHYNLLSPIVANPKDGKVIVKFVYDYQRLHTLKNQTPKTEHIELINEVLVISQFSTLEEKTNWIGDQDITKTIINEIIFKILSYVNLPSQFKINFSQILEMSVSTNSPTYSKLNLMLDEIGLTREEFDAHLKEKIFKILGQLKNDTTTLIAELTNQIQKKIEFLESKGGDSHKIQITALRSDMRSVRLVNNKKLQSFVTGNGWDVPSQN